MNFTITIIPDRAYYKEAYSEMIKSRTLKRLEPVFAIIMIVFGIWLSWFDTHNFLGKFSWLFSAVGVYELFKVYYSRYKWIRARMDSTATGQEIQVQFTSEALMETGPFSHGTLKWIGMKSITETEKGIIIRPESGISLYLSKDSFDTREQIDFILSRHHGLN